MATVLDIPFVSGNVSFYNESATGSVPPTPTIMAVGLVNDVRNCPAPSFKRDGNPIYLVGKTTQEMGGSEYYRYLDIQAGCVPRSDPHLLKKSMETLCTANDRHLIAACHDVSNGGLAVALSEMVIGGKGAEICLYPLPDLRTDFKLFSESNTRWVVEVAQEKETEFKHMFKGLPIYNIGQVTNDQLVIYDGDSMTKYIDIGKEQLAHAWQKTLWDVMG
jgi:phosphoribosylformylglycinamidine synthase